MPLIDFVSISLYLFVSCRRMVTETRSVARGHNLGQGRGHGRGRNVSPHVTVHENPVQEEIKEEING